MDTIILEKKWAGINREISGDFTSIRISEDCIPDLYIGYNVKANRCLILSLSKDTSVDFKDEIREHISIQYFDRSRHIVIQLGEDRFNDLFNSFIISVYQTIKSIKNSNHASAALLKVYYEWSDFFSALVSNKLSFNELLGLVGEILLLNRLIRESSSENINDLLNGWTGPFDKGHDFCFSNKDIEVKTKEVSRIEVLISSEFQLEPAFGKMLELAVISVLINVEEGKTLQTLIIETRDLIIGKLGELPIFIKAIGRKGLNLMNLAEYDEYNFKVKSITTYNCIAEGFPKLSVSNIPKNITHLKFSLMLNNLNDYIIEQIDY
jgi:hypothetical protein